MTDVADRLDTEQMNLRGEEYETLRNYSGFSLDIPSQNNYMMNPEYRGSRTYRNLLHRIRPGDRDMVSVQFRYNVRFAMDSTFSVDSRRALVSDGMRLIERVNDELLMLSDNPNDLELRMPMVSGRSFYGLYEIPILEYNPDVSLIENIFSGPNRRLPVLSKYNNYTTSLERFINRDYRDALAVFTGLDSGIDPNVIDREVEQFEEVSVIESPGLQLPTILRLLNLEPRNDIRKILHVKWTIRVALIVSRSRWDSWLRHTNLSHLEPTLENARRWPGFFGFRLRG